MLYVHCPFGIGVQPIPQFGDSRDRVESSVFSQCVRNDFHGVRKLLKGWENQVTGGSQIPLTLKQYASAPARLFA